MGFETDNSAKINIHDYDDAPFYHLLLEMPPELARTHIKHIEREGMTDEESTVHLESIIVQRTEKVSAYSVNDERIQQAIKGREKEFFKTLDTTVFHSVDNYLGTGMTAIVKFFEVQTDTGPIPVAVKFVTTPTKKTISAEQEHGVIKEVERMQKVAKMQQNFPNRGKHVSVPSPFFHHTTDKIQLYGMEHIDGVTLESVYTDTGLPHELKSSLRDSPLAKISFEELEGYIERFLTTMHEYCLHGDIKPRNIMVDKKGHLYIIDFGQSVLSNNFDEKSQDAFENLKIDEIKQTKLIVRKLLSRIRED